VVYYKAADGSVPAFTYLLACPPKLHAHLAAIIDAVAAAPPPAFSGGGKWEAMRGAMAGYYEVRATGPRRTHHRLFCILENADDPEELRRRGLERKAIVVLCGMEKANATLFRESDYAHVRRLGDDHRRQFPRRIAEPDDV
jgi:hypothetical protein